jgi:hypothetical protein
VGVNKELVRRFYEEVWDRGNIEFAHEVFADDYVRHDLRPTKRRAVAWEFCAYRGLKNSRCGPHDHLGAHFAPGAFDAGSAGSSRTAGGADRRGRGALAPGRCR